MVHIITVHYFDYTWINIQLKYFEENIKEPFQVYACLNGIDQSYFSKFHYAVDYVSENLHPETKGHYDHREKLNVLSGIALSEAVDDDLIVFIDGDAIPIGDLIDFCKTKLREFEFVSIEHISRRPHPIFCICRVSTWRGYGANWRIPRDALKDRDHQICREDGNRWPESGSLYMLHINSTVRISADRFAVFEDRLYHHGAGFRTAFHGHRTADHIIEQIKCNNRFYKRLTSSNYCSDCIVVLGMHRSGTSVLTKALGLMGASLGSDLGRKHAEHLGVRRQNIKILRRFGHGWQVDSDLPHNWKEETFVQLQINAIKFILLNEFFDRKLFAIKDPRICLLIPIYRRIFEDLRIRPHFVVIERPNLEIARSLGKRNHFHLPQSQRITRHYKKRLDLDLADLPHVRISYHELLQNPIATLDKIRLELALPLKTSSELRNEMLALVDKPDSHKGATGFRALWTILWCLLVPPLKQVFSPKKVRKASRKASNKSQ